IGDEVLGSVRRSPLPYQPEEFLLYLFFHEKPSYPVGMSDIVESFMETTRLVWPERLRDYCSY
ncbi:MAG: hypothetical protein ACPL7J_14980, partial [Desulfomonilaceae bacterium]